MTRRAVIFVASAPLWFQAALVWVATLFVYLPTAWFGDRQNTDTWAAVLPAWHLAQLGTLDLSGYDGGIPWRVEVGDATYTNRFPGVFAAGVPFYALLGTSAEPTIYPGAVAAAFWAAGAVAVAYAVAARLMGRRAALLAAAVLALATPTWSVSADAMWSHGPNQFWLLLAVLGLASARPVRAGLAAAVTTLVRPHMAVAWAGAALHAAVSSRSARRPALFLLAAALGPALLVLYNWQVFETPGVLGGYRDEHLTAGGVGPLVLVVNVLGALVSPHRGVLLLTPFLLLLLPGLRAGWRRSPPWVRSAAVAGLLYAAVQLYLIRFIGGHGFYSYRTMIEPLTFLFPLLVVSYGAWTARHPVRRAAFWGLVVLAAGFHSFGAVLDRHRVESGNPFREFGAVAVAQDAGPVVTVAWVVVTLAGAWFAARRAWRHEPGEPTPEPSGSAGPQEGLEPVGSQVPGELPLDAGAPRGPHPG